MSPKTESTPTPVIRVTRYDAVSTTMIVIIIGLALIVGLLILVWMSHHKFEVAAEPEFKVLFTENPGGFLDGTEGQTLGGAEGPPAQFSDVESAPETEMDPNTPQTTIQPDFDDTLASVSSSAPSAPPQMLPRRAANIGERNSGINFKQKGTGRKGLGDGPGVGGFGREQRWFVRFDQGALVEEYAKQLDFFKISLGALLPDGTLIYISNVSQATPTKRVVPATEESKSLYMVWQTPARRKVDEELMRKAGVDATNAVLMHSYPPDTEQKLAKAEQGYRGLDPKQIAKTFFKVRPDGSGGYVFEVTSQLTIK